MFLKFSTGRFAYFSSYRLNHLFVFASIASLSLSLSIFLSEEFYPLSLYSFSSFRRLDFIFFTSELDSIIPFVSLRFHFSLYSIPFPLSFFFWLYLISILQSTTFSETIVLYSAFSLHKNFSPRNASFSITFLLKVCEISVTIILGLPWIFSSLPYYSTFFASV